MLSAFSYAIADLPVDEQIEMRELMKPVYEKLMKATNGGKHSTHH